MNIIKSSFIVFIYKICCCSFQHYFFKILSSSSSSWSSSLLLLGNFFLFNFHLCLSFYSIVLVVPVDRKSWSGHIRNIIYNLSPFSCTYNIRMFVVFYVVIIIIIIIVVVVVLHGARATTTFPWYQMTNNIPRFCPLGPPKVN